MPRIKIARVLGIPIYVDLSWFLLFAFVTWTLASTIYPDLLPRRSERTYLGMAAGSALVFFSSILVHELAHSVVAKYYKIPVKSITLFLLGGVAQITREATTPMRELLMAGAGPLSSLLIGGAFIGSYVAFDVDGDTVHGAMIIWIGLINIVLGVFNMIPAFPMDGGRVFRSLIWLVTKNYYRATRIAGWIGRGFAWVIIGVGALSAFGFDMKVVSDEPIGIMMFIFIGFWLESAARQGLVQNKLVETLTKYRASDLMVADPPVVDSRMSIAALARGVIDINPGVTYFVEEEGVLTGILSGYQMRAVPEPQWETTTAEQAMLPSRKLLAIAPDRLANDILIEMETANLTHLPVVSNGRVLGVVGRDRILRVLQKSGLIT